MRYFVLGSDGQRFGPADIDSLNMWIAEGRLAPNSRLVEETSGAEVAASSVAGLMFAPPTPMAPPTAAYPRQLGASDIGEKDLRDAWICAILSLICSAGCIGLILALYAQKLAKRAADKGNPSTQGPLIISWISIGIFVLSIILYGALRTRGT